MHVSCSGIYSDMHVYISVYRYTHYHVLPCVGISYHILSYMIMHCELSGSIYAHILDINAASKHRASRGLEPVLAAQLGARDRELGSTSKVITCTVRNRRKVFERLGANLGFIFSNFKEPENVY